MGRRRRKGRAVDGILLLDKPAGLTSNQALQKVRRLFNAVRAGHTGTLDPLATGLLPICFGEATKTSAYLLDSDKTYLTDARFGTTTTTADADGDPVEVRSVEGLDTARIAAVLEKFRGPVMQVPPMYSALKIDGKRLHQLARAGQHVEREARPVEIFELELMHYRSGLARFRVRCSKGTYIRSLVEDIGQVLGVGAHVETLRRLAVGGFDGQSMVSLDSLVAASSAASADQSGTDVGGAVAGYQVLDRLLLPVEAALQHLVRVELDSPDDIRAFCHGQAIEIPASYDAQERPGLNLSPVSAAEPVRSENLEPALVRVAAGRRFLGLGRIVGGELAPSRLFHVKS